MKKTYINPELTVVKIATAQMLAASVGFGKSVEDASEATARGYDFDDEE